MYTLFNRWYLCSVYFFWRTLYIYIRLILVVSKRLNVANIRHHVCFCFFRYGFVIYMLKAQWSLCVPYSDHYMYRTVVTICTVQWSVYVPYSGHYMYRTV
jgi:hypothetical protein